MLSVVNDDSTAPGPLIDEIVREGARRIPAAALEAEVEVEVDQYMAELVTERDENGKRLIARDGYHRPRTVTTATRPVEIRVPPRERPPCR
ncbi:hypothetical protein V4Y04_37055 [Streptomyces sp. P9-A2]